jgi:pimeloyl-ACP methyl ester carboxylesterase
LRYDKRASGRSGGVYEDTDLDILASDVVQVVKYLKKRFQKPVLVIGQSEGGLTTVLAQAREPVADALVLQCGMLAPLDEILAHQKTRAAKSFLDDTGPMFDQLPYYYSLYQKCYNRPAFLEAIHKASEKHFLFQHQD